MLLLCTSLKFCHSVNSESFTTQSQLLTTLRKKAFENILGKGENAGNQHFLLLPKCFLPFQKQISDFVSHLFCLLLVLSIWTGLKFCRLERVKALIVLCSQVLTHFQAYVKNKDFKNMN